MAGEARSGDDSRMGESRGRPCGGAVAGIAGTRRAEVAAGGSASGGAVVASVAGAGSHTGVTEGRRYPARGAMACVA